MTEDELENSSEDHLKSFNKKTVRVLSLGAGVQSSALLLLSDRGLAPKPDFAVFADTGAEPKSVYKWLDFLETKVSIPIYRSMYRNLYEDTINNWNNYLAVPFFVLGNDGKKGMGRRQCTHKYKIEVVYKEIRKRLGYGYKKHMRHSVFIQLGISLDEFQRMKDSRIKWVTNEFPLIYDCNFTREDCIGFVEAEIGRIPPRSACTFCPYHSDKEWDHMKKNDPESFAQAVEVDDAIRNTKKMRGKNFLHRSLKPLSEIDFSNPNKDERQITFDDECDGICGV